MALKAVDWVRRIRDKHYAETKDMTFDELKRYIEEKAEETHRRLQARKQRRKASASR